MIVAKMVDRVLEESREPEKVFFTSKNSATMTAQIATRDSTVLGMFNLVVG